MGAALLLLSPLHAAAPVRVALPPVAVGSGLAIMSERPFTNIERIDGGFAFALDGLVRVAAGAHRVEIALASAPALPEVEDATGWIVYGKEDGLATITLGKTPRTIVYCRSRSPVRAVRK